MDSYETVANMRDRVEEWFGRDDADDLDAVLDVIASTAFGEATSVLPLLQRQRLQERLEKTPKKRWTNDTTTTGQLRHIHQFCSSRVLVNVQTGMVFSKHEAAQLHRLPRRLRLHPDALPLLISRRGQKHSGSRVHGHRAAAIDVLSTDVATRFRIHGTNVMIDELAVRDADQALLSAAVGMPKSVGEDDGETASKRKATKFHFEGVEYGRNLLNLEKYRALDAHETFLIDVISTVMRATFGQQWKTILPTFMDLLLPASVVFDVDDDESGPPAIRMLIVRRSPIESVDEFSEMIIVRANHLMIINDLEPHGLFVVRVPVYRSDSRMDLVEWSSYSMSTTTTMSTPTLPPQWVESLKRQKRPPRRAIPGIQDASDTEPSGPQKAVLITRLTAEGSKQTFVPGRFLRGLVPDTLLSMFNFWRLETIHNDQFTLMGYPRELAEERGNAVDDGNGEHEEEGPFVIEIEVHRVTKRLPTTLFGSWHAHIRRLFVRSRFDHDGREDDNDTGSALDLANANCQRRLRLALKKMGDIPPPRKALAELNAAPSQALLDLTMATNASALHRIAGRIYELDDLAFVLVWSTSTTVPGSVVDVGAIEIVRAKVTLQDRKSVV
jgi:hypothetical protein